MRETVVYNQFDPFFDALPRKKEIFQSVSHLVTRVEEILHFLRVTNTAFLRFLEEITLFSIIKEKNCRKINVTEDLNFKLQVEFSFNRWLRCS